MGETGDEFVASEWCESLCEMQKALRKCARASSDARAYDVAGDAAATNNLHLLHTPAGVARHLHHLAVTSGWTD